MISGAYNSPFQSDPDVRPHPPSTGPLNINTEHLFGAILDELISILKAQAVVLTVLVPGRSELLFQVGRGEWSRFTGKHFQIERDLLFLMTTSGEIQLTKGCLLPLPLMLVDMRGSMQRLYHTPLVHSGHHIGAIWLGHASAIPAESLPLLSAIADVLSSMIHSVQLENLSPHSARETIQTLVKKLAILDPVTFNHSLRMVPWAKATASALGCSEPEIRMVCWATLLHDIGKLSVPKSILFKPGKLSRDEWAVMQLHPSVGARMVSAVKGLSQTRDLIIMHHEKVDGSGYPYGLKTDAIPLGARILAVVDAYAAMTEDRLYKRTYSHSEALSEIESCTGRHFDPTVSQAFLNQFR